MRIKVKKSVFIISDNGVNYLNQSLLNYINTTNVYQSNIRQFVIILDSQTVNPNPLQNNFSI